MTSLGMTIGGPYGVLPASARAVEEAGFDAVWVAETGQSAIIQAAVVAQATGRVQVGTNIALAFPTAPAQMALQAWDLGELSGGRFTIGLGSQVRRIVQDRFGVDFRPAAQRMREYVEAMRTTWAMHTGRSAEPYEGELYHVRHPGVTGTGFARGTDLPDPPTYVAGQEDGICVELVVPAPVDDDVARQAADLAGAVVEHVGGVGLVAVELFLDRGGRLLVNELALRPHNSVHWSIEGARTSQFQNHARAVLDLPLGATDPTAPAIATVNVLGPADGSDPRTRLRPALAVEGVAVHLYGKDPRPGRKLGHVTALADDVATARERAHLAAARLTGDDQDT